MDVSWQLDLLCHTNRPGETVKCDLNQISSRGRTCLFPEELLLLSVYPGLLLLLSPLVTGEEMLDVELEDSLGEVVKFLDEVVLDLTSESKKKKNMHQRCKFVMWNVQNIHFKRSPFAYLGCDICLGHVPSSFFRSITRICGKTDGVRRPLHILCEDFSWWGIKFVYRDAQIVKFLLCCLFVLYFFLNSFNNFDTDFYPQSNVVATAPLFSILFFLLSLLFEDMNSSKHSIFRVFQHGCGKIAQ